MNLAGGSRCPKLHVLSLARHEFPGGNRSGRYPAPGREPGIEPLDPSPALLRKHVEHWFLELRDPLFRYLRSMGCHHSPAEEITQETFLRLRHVSERLLPAGPRFTRQI